MTKAAFLYQQAKRADLAHAVAQRVLVELRSLLAPGVLEAYSEYDPRLTPPYLWEMLGDAVVCIDHDQARQAYAKAAEFFAKLTDLDEASEGADPFPGWHFAFMVNHFLERQPGAHLKSDHRLRLPAKRRQWLGD